MVCCEWSLTTEEKKTPFYFNKVAHASEYKVRTRTGVVGEVMEQTGLSSASLS